MRRASRLGRRARYWFDNTMSGGTPALVGWLTAVSVVLVVLTSVALTFAQPVGPDGLPADPIRLSWDNFVRVFRLGVPASGSAPALALWLLLGLTGVFIASALIGLVTSALLSKMTELHKGRSVVAETGHTVVLGWSDQIFTVVAELIEANASRGRAAVVILADQDKATMDDAIRERVPQSRGTRVVCRTGLPIDSGDLELVAPNDARSVIVLSPPEDDDADTHVMKTLLALTNGTAFRGSQHHIVAAVRDSRNVAVARLAGGDQATVIDADDITARLLVQTARQAGLSAVYLDLLDYGGNELYLVRDPKLTGRTFGELALAYPAGCPIGVVDIDGRSRLNPPAGEVIYPGDRLILLAEDDSAITAGDGSATVELSSVLPASPRAFTAQRTLILGWNRRGRGVVRHLESYAAPQSSVDIVTDRADAVSAACELTGQVYRLAITLKEADPADRDVLSGLDLTGYDHIMLLSDDELGPLHADSRVLATLLHVRDLISRTGRRVSIVSEIRDDRDRDLAQLTEADDCVVSEKLISLLMTQVSECRELAGVFAQLFDAAGSEIYLRPIGDYVHPRPGLTFATLAKAAALRGELALGYRSVSAARDGQRMGVVLNPAKGAPLQLRADDRIILLAEH